MVISHQSNQKKSNLPRTFRAFESIGYRFLWMSSLSTNISRYMQLILLMWLVLELKHSPFLVALVGFFGMAPMFLFGLLGGIMADRWSKQRLLMITAGLGVLVSITMWLLLVFASVQFWHAYLVILISGVGFAIDLPARRFLIHDLLGRIESTNGFAFDSVALSASRMIGPALAGGLIAFAGVSGGYVVVTIFYATSFMTLWRLESLEIRWRTKNHSVDSFRNIVTNLRHVTHQPVLVAIIMTTIVMNLFLYSYANMVPVIAIEILGVGPGLMGLLQASDGLGALVGAVIIASVSTINYHGRFFIAGSLLAMGALLIFSLSIWYMVSLPILMVLGLGTAGFSTMQTTIVLLVSPRKIRGVALGVMSLAIGAGPFGALLVGWLAEVNGPGFTLSLTACLGILLVFLIAVVIPSIRQPIKYSHE